MLNCYNLQQKQWLFQSYLNFNHNSENLCTVNFLPRYSGCNPTFSLSINNKFNKQKGTLIFSIQIIIPFSWAQNNLFKILIWRDHNGRNNTNTRSTLYSPPYYTGRLRIRNVSWYVRYLVKDNYVGNIKRFGVTYDNDPS